MTLVRSIPIKEGYSNSFNSSKVYSNELNENYKKKKLSESFNHQIQQEETYKTNRIAADIVNTKRFNLLEKIQIKSTEKAFINELARIYIDALNVDNEFILEHENIIKKFLLSKVTELSEGNIYDFMNNVKRNSNFLNKLVEACKKAGENTKNKIEVKLKKENECETTNEQLQKIFEPEDKEVEDDICVDAKEVSEIVKDHVLKVIQDEEEESEKKKQLIDDLNNSEALGESLQLFSNDVDEKYSLFHSLMIKNHKECIKNLHEGTDIGEYGSIDNDGNAKVNLDYVLFDSILEYTTLELFSVTKMKHYTGRELKDMAYNIAYSN